MTIYRLRTPFALMAAAAVLTAGLTFALPSGAPIHHKRADLLECLAAATQQTPVGECRAMVLGEVATFKPGGLPGPHMTYVEPDGDRVVKLEYTVKEIAEGPVPSE